jgi:sec-independent protein translocase protein TatB
MFNISFAELIVILLVAFLVLGPKEMGKVARGLGRGVKKCQKFVMDMKTFVNESAKDTPLEDVKKTACDVKETVNSVKNEVDKMNPVSDIKKEIDAEIKPIQDIKNMKNINPAKKEMDNLKKSK